MIKELLQFPKMVWSNRALIWKLAKNDFKTRYAGSNFGVLWALVQPVMIVMVYWFVFEVGLSAGSQTVREGLFSGRIPLVFFTNMPTNAGTVQYKAALGPAGDKVDMNAFAGGLQVDKNGKATIAALRDKLVSLGYPYEYKAEEGVLPSSIAAVDPKFKMPQVWKTSLAVDYNFPTSFPFSITAEGIFNKTVNAVCASDWSLLPPEGFAKFNGVALVL